MKQAYVCYLGPARSPGRESPVVPEQAIRAVLQRDDIAPIEGKVHIVSGWWKQMGQIQAALEAEPTSLLVLVIHDGASVWELLHFLFPLLSAQQARTVFFSYYQDELEGLSEVLTRVDMTWQVPASFTS